MPTARPRAGLTCAALASLILVAGCERPVGCTGEYCGTMVIASGGEPDILLPPVSEFSITRDVTDQLFLKLADLGASGTRSATRTSSHSWLSGGSGTPRRRWCFISTREPAGRTARR